MVQCRFPNYLYHHSEIRFCVCVWVRVGEGGTLQREVSTNSTWDGGPHHEEHTVRTTRNEYNTATSMTRILHLHT